MPISFRQLIGLLVAVLSFPAAGGNEADIFRCRENAVPSYQGTECMQSGSRLELQVPEPNHADRKLADLTHQRERDFVRRLEAERERTMRMADTERAEATLAESRQTLRCQRYARLADRLEDNSGSTRGTTRKNRLKDIRARELRDRYFTECLGRR